MTFKLHVALFALISVTALLLPLLVFAPMLARVRKEGLVFMSGSAHRGAEHLNRHLRASQSGELPSSEVSGLTDFGVLYENARLMRPLPMEPQDVVALLVAAVLPFVPLVFLVMPAQEVFQALRKLIL